MSEGQLITLTGLARTPVREAMQRLAFDYGLDTMRLKATIAEHLVERERYALR